MEQIELTKFRLKCWIDRNGTITHQKTISVSITAPAQVCSNAQKNFSIRFEGIHIPWRECPNEKQKYQRQLQKHAYENYLSIHRLFFHKKLSKTDNINNRKQPSRLLLNMEKMKSW